MTTTTQIINLFERIRLTATPLVKVNTADAAATRAAFVRTAIHVDGEAVPILGWDAVGGLVGLNDEGRTSLATAIGSSKLNHRQPTTALQLALKVQRVSDDPDAAAPILFASQLGTFLRDPVVAQAAWNLRDPYKADGRTLVMLDPGGSLPSLLQHDVYIIDEPLPGADELEAIVASQFDAARQAVPSLSNPDTRGMRSSVAALTGLAAFPAEQAVALSMGPDGLDLAALRSRRKQMIEQHAGAQLLESPLTFADVGGQDALKAFAREAVIDSEHQTSLVVFIDEVEKQFGGSTQAMDSGASRAQLGQVLTFLEEVNADGITLVGHRGCGKTHFAQALGSEAGIPVIAANFARCKGKMVGETEEQTEHLLRVVKACAGQTGNVLFVVTSNDLSAMPPELRRRLSTLGTFFVDLPGKEEKAAVWQLKLAEHGLDVDQPRPNDTDWTGADIRNCCRVAARMGKSVVDAATWVVPTAQADPESIERLRHEANGRYLNVSVAGTFQHGRADDVEELPDGPLARHLRLTAPRGGES